MVQFGQYLLTHRQPGWESFYLDYKQLKKEIGRYERVVPDACDDEKDEMARRFSEHLDSQIEKVVLFFLQQQGQLAAALQELRQVRDAANLEWKLPGRTIQEEPRIQLVTVAERPVEDSASGGGEGSPCASTSAAAAAAAAEAIDAAVQSSGQLVVQVVGRGEGGGREVMDTDAVTREVEEIMDRYRGVASRLLLLLQFVELNATGLRKILKKFDRRVAGQGHLTLGYVSSRAQHPYSHIQQMFKQVGLGAMVGTIIRNLDELHRLKQRWQHRAGLSPSSSLLPSSPLARTSSYSLYHTAGADPVAYVAEQEPIIKEIEAARAKLSSAVSFSSYMARGLLLPAPPERVPLPEEEPEFHWWSLQLNQVNTFLYMVNYYIIVPTSDEYAVDLSAPASLCGVIIGATPLCALVSAFIFSRWSNRSYSEPLIVSTVLLLLGNFCYASALDYQSVALLLIGRSLTGLGGVRAINRRYIADHVPTSERTSASAAFVSVGALGMAAGPFIAGLTHSFRLKLFGFTVNSVTSPGWIMLLLWLVYLLLVLLYFKEPNRAHLKTTPPSNSSSSSTSHQPPRKSSSAQALVAGGKFKQLLGSSSATGGENSSGEGNSKTGGGGKNGGISVTKRHNSSDSLLEKGGRGGGKRGGASGQGASAAVTGGNEANIRTWLLAADQAEAETTRSAVSWEEDEDEDKGGAVETFSELMGELTAPIQVLLFLYFMIKFATEVLISESSLISKFYFQWTINDIGSFLGLLGLTVLPISSAVGNFITNIYEDRLVVVWTQVIIGVGVAMALCFAPFVPYTTQQYVVTAVIVFVSCNVLEGVSLSLLSRIMSPRLSRGTFNCGLLSTEAGTFARVVGDGLITLTGYLGTAYVLNLTMLPVLVSVVLALGLFRAYYSAMY